MLKNAVKCAFVFATTGADPDVHEPRDNVRRHQRLYRLFYLLFSFSLFHFAFQFAFPQCFLRVFGHDPQERFLSSAFLLRRSGHRGPSRFFRSRLFSARIRRRRAGQHASPQSTVCGRHRPFVSHGSKPAVATELLLVGFSLVSPTRE